MITIYDNEELAGILVLLLRNTLDGTTPFNTFQDQIDGYNSVVQSLDPGDLFRQSITAFRNFYALGAAEKALVDNAQTAIANLFNGIVDAEASGAVSWGECSYITLAQVAQVAGLSLSPGANQARTLNKPKASYSGSK
jgi:hypothetical protein